MSEWSEYAEAQEQMRPIGEKLGPIGKNAKEVLEGQVKDLWKAEKTVARLEEELKAAKQVLRNISEMTLPATLEDMGLEEVTVSGGIRVAIKESVHASPKADRRDEMYDWLEENGHGGLIKRTGTFSIGIGQERKAKAWIKKIKAYPGRFERKVEPSTLRSFVNEQLKAGVEIPMELFGAYTRRVAQVKSG